MKLSINNFSNGFRNHMISVTWLGIPKPETIFIRERQQKAVIHV